MESQLKKTALNYGLFLGLILSFLTFIAYIFNLSLLTKWWYGIIVLIFVIAMGILSVSKAKSILEGFITFKQAFTSWFITLLIGVLISSIISFVLFNIIDPQASELLIQATIESTVSMMESFGVPQSEIDKSITAIESQNQFELKNIIKGFVFQLIFYSVIGLIVALVMKKSNPNLE